MPSRQLLNASPSRLKTTIIFLTITAFASLIILFAIIYFLYYLYYSLVHRSRTSPFDSTTPLVKLQRFTYKELKSATNGFNATNIIGKGGSGTVFGGILKDGKLVAIKLLDSNSLQSEREFQNELQVLGWLRRSQLIVCLLGYCVEKSKRLVVYEYMPNKSLQESLFSECDYSLNWCKRFDIVLDIANALSFLHIECDPPVIHGDVKPSNVLLDSDYRAKLSDFGLARLKLDGEIGVDMFSQDLGKSQDLWKSQELSGNLSIGAGVGGEGETPAFSTPKRSHDEVDFAMALQASSSSKSNKLLSPTVIKSLALNSFNCKGNVVTENACEGKNVVKGKGISSVEIGGEDWSRFGNYDDELSSIDHSKELNLNAGMFGDYNRTKGAKQWGKDWWWRQDGSGELCSKDYVMEWIGSQICSSTTADWEEERRCSPEKSNLENSMPLDKFEEVNETQLGDPAVECTKNDVKKDGSNRWKMCNKKHRKMQEWWKEEHFDELSRKSRSKRNEVNTLESKFKKRVKVPHFGLGKRFQFRGRKFSKETRNILDQDREFSFRRSCKKKNSPSFGSDMWSGDLFSRELSSTTSMRGTLCYVAPEYGGCGYLMEKSDIYSLGVLILVIVSGRRPLHVLSSPMKLEKANLISWCRNLAQSGNILELVDERLKDDYNKDQANLCINLALACIQKMPELRPDIVDIAKILKGEMELPPLPFEFSPSPPSKLFSTSRRKQKSSGD